MRLVGRDGNLSLIRLGTIAAALGIILVVGGVVVFFLDRSSHQVPLEVEPFPGATQWYQQPRSDVSRSVFFQIPGGSADEVAAYYEKKMNEFYGNADESCVRVPSIGNFPEFDRGTANVPPFQYSCMFDRSGFQISQFTRVNIQPGIASNKTEGMVIVEHEQYWQR